MKNALISPNEQVFWLSGWTETIEPIYTPISNAERIAEVADASFPVAPPLFWIDCADNVVADQFYYNKIDQTIFPVPDPTPPPEPVPPVTSGTQTL